MERQYKNYAFISYKREDEKWAKWLQRKLEHYKLPTSVRKANPSLPEYIRPVFKDTTDLAGGVLEKSIIEALLSSKFLIVICSPRAALSPWVCKEVQEFIDSGKEEYIIPFIVDGEPNSKNSFKECFPYNLRELSGSRELLGININEMGRNAAAIKVVARILDLQFDTLWQRWERERHYHRMWIASLLCLGIVIALIITCVMFFQHRKMQINQALAVSYRATQLIERGHSSLAQKILVEVLPDKNDFIRRPYVPEAEATLRLAQNNESRSFYGHDFGVNYASFSPDGRYIVSASADNTIKLWDVETERCIKTFEEHTETVNTVSFSSDGKYIVSASEDKTIKLWDVDTKRCIKTFEGHTEAVNTVSFSPDGKYIVSASEDKTIKLWDVDTKRCLKTFEGHTKTVNTVSFSPDGKSIVSSSRDDTIKLWDVETGKCLDTYVIYEPIIQLSSIYEYPENSKYILSVSNEATCKIWDKDSKQCLETIYGEKKAVLSAKFVYGGYIAWSSTDNQIRYLCIDKNKIKRPQREVELIDGDHISFSPDGKYIASALKDNSIKVWDANTNECIKTYEGHTDDVNSINFSSNGEYIVSASSDKSVKLYKINTGIEYSKVFEKENDWINDMNFSPTDEKHFVYSIWDGSIKLRSIETGNLIKTFEGHTEAVTTVSFSPDGKSIVSSSWDNTIKLWDVKTEECIKTIDCSNKNGYLINFGYISPNGKYIIFALNKTIHLYEINTNKCIKTFEGHSAFVTSVGFSPNGKYFISSSEDATIKLWNIAKGKCVKNIEGHTGTVTTVSFSPDGKSIVSASSDKTIKLWDVGTKRCIKTFEGHTGTVKTVSFSPDGKSIVSSSQDGVKIWDVSTAKCLMTLDGAMAIFSPDGMSILLVNELETIKLINFKSLQDMIDNVHEKYKNTPLTEDERRENFLES